MDLQLPRPLPPTQFDDERCYGGIQEVSQDQRVHAGTSLQIILLKPLMLIYLIILVDHECYLWANDIFLTQ